MSTKVNPIPTERLVVNIGPSHPITHGTLRIQMELDGETIVNAACEIGYLHRGFEKACENVFYEQVVPYAERLNYMSPVYNSAAWCWTVEQMLGIEAPPRAQAIRVIVGELARMMDHTVCIGTNLVDLGALTNFFYTWNFRELVYDLMEELAGARHMVNYPRIGGVAADLPDGWIEKALKTVDDIGPMLDDVKGLVLKNRIFLDRTVGIGVIDRDMAMSWGVTGPVLRAAGVPYDVRKARPYWGYENYDFEVPVAKNGDTYDRFMVRFAEIEQSRRIIRQAIEKLPDGPVLLDDPRFVRPPKEQVYNTMEGLIAHFKLVMHGARPPAGDFYASVEGGNGELGFYVVSDGGPRAWRVRVRPPCFQNFSVFPHAIRGQMLADAVATLGSINIIAGELDR